MEYLVRKMVIASELAAKPPSQASAYLVNYLRNLDRVAKALDYGCGKLRYTKYLAEITDSLTLVDSSRQLDRLQKIDGEKTTVRQMASNNWRHVRIETIQQFEEAKRPKFDFALCANVLSAIPSKSARSRALKAIHNRLKINGILLVVNQHTNSFYTQVSRRENVEKHLDGWLVLNKGHASYYGILNKNKIDELLQAVGYKILEHWIDGQSNYALASKQR